MYIVNAVIQETPTAAGCISANQLNSLIWASDRAWGCRGSDYNWNKIPNCKRKPRAFRRLNGKCTQKLWWKPSHAIQMGSYAWIWPNSSWNGSFRSQLSSGRDLILLWPSSAYKGLNTIKGSCSDSLWWYNQTVLRLTGREKQGLSRMLSYV